MISADGAQLGDVFLGLFSMLYVLLWLTLLFGPFLLGLMTFLVGVAARPVRRRHVPVGAAVTVALLLWHLFLTSQGSTWRPVLYGWVLALVGAAASWLRYTRSVRRGVRPGGCRSAIG